MSMGVYIPDMEMPKSCPECPFNSRAWYEDSHRCLASNKKIKVNLNTGFDDNCPLVPVPPHGRLVDADAIREEIDEKRPGRSYEDAWTLTVIDAAPTVIPANVEVTE